MTRKTLYKRKFQCPACDTTDLRYKWSDDETPEVCACGKNEELIEVPMRSSGNPSAYINKFSSLPNAEKRKILRKRADKDFEKNHKEKKIEIDRDFERQAREIINRKKG